LRVISAETKTEHAMTQESDNSIKDVEVALIEDEERAKALEQQLAGAEAKHQPKIDHASDGGVI